MSQSGSPLRAVTLGLYRALLYQAKHLFDENARQFALNRIRFRFRDNMKELGASRIQQHLKEARHELQFLKRTNLGDLKAVNKMLALTYGRIGKRKHQLLAPYYGEPAVPKEPMISNVARSAPPAIPPPIQALMNRDPNVKTKFEMDNPPVYKPLSKRREVNAMWKFYSKQRKNLRAPLPKAEIETLRGLADGVTIKLPQSDNRQKLLEEYARERASTGKYRGKPTGLRPRFLRRRYQSLLKEHIPMISYENNNWLVETNTGWKQKYPLLDPKHTYGPTLFNGMKMQAVNSKGEFIRSERE